MRKWIQVLVVGSVAGGFGSVGWWLWSHAPQARPPGRPLRAAPALVDERLATAASVAASVVKPPPSAPAAEPPWSAEEDALADTLDEQRRQLLKKMKLRLALSDETVAKLRAIIERSNWLGQGNPQVTRHPMTRAECRAIRRKAGLKAPAPEVCGAKNMVPLFAQPVAGSALPPRVCIDQFEFPNIACEYPVVWVQANEAAELCRALGKRLCDAHEWEGACAGNLRPPDQEYAWGQRRMQMRYLHNHGREVRWAYGAEKDHLKCATQSHKSATCSVIGWRKCGSNTYPAGAFPQCASPFGVYDLHGNAAEHMSLPLAPEQLGSRGGSGATEMKGSWFIFSTYEAHLDDCRWRAPDWHGTKVMDPNSHRNYHLGFRCCKDIALAHPPTGPALAPRAE